MLKIPIKIVHSEINEYDIIVFLDGTTTSEIEDYISFKMNVLETVYKITKSKKPHIMHVEIFYPNGNIKILRPERRCKQ